MRADAEVDEGLFVFDRVAGDLRLAFGLLVDQLHLERLAPAREKLLRLVARPHLALVDQILLRELVHLLLDRLEIFRHERTRDDEVVEEAFVRRGTDAALRAGKQVGDGRRKQVRRAVPQQRERFGTAVGDDLHLRVVGERKGEIDQLVVDGRGQRCLRETGRDRLGHRADGCASRKFAARPIWKRDVDLGHVW